MAESRILSTFGRMDLNHTGVVSRAQLKEVLLSLGENVWDEKVVDELLAAFCADRPGSDDVPYAEFLSWIGEGGTFNEAASLDAREICGELGAELEDKDNMIANLQRELQLAKAQVGRLSDVEAESLAGTNPSPLHLAALNGETETVQMLSTAVALKATNSKGLTPLHLAAFQGHSDTVRALLAAGANKEARCQQGQTPLHFSARRGHVDTTGILLEAGAKVSAESSSGVKPKDLATDADVISMLAASEASA